MLLSREITTFYNIIGICRLALVERYAAHFSLLFEYDKAASRGMLKIKRPDCSYFACMNA